MLYWAGPRFAPVFKFLQKNGGGGCHPGQALVKCYLPVIPQSYGGADFLIYSVSLNRHEGDLTNPIRVNYLAPPIMASPITYEESSSRIAQHNVYMNPRPSLP